jgi:hypothetical protein
MSRSWSADMSFAKNASKSGFKNREVALFAEILRNKPLQLKLQQLLAITVW